MYIYIYIYKVGELYMIYTYKLINDNLKKNELFVRIQNKNRLDLHELNVNGSSLWCSGIMIKFNEDKLKFESEINMSVISEVW